MALPSVYDKNVVEEIKNRLNKIQSNTAPLWGKMNASQMLAHINVGYHLSYDESIPKATGLKKIMLKLFVKGIVTNEKPYKKNGRTSPEFVIADERDFDKEKELFNKNLDQVLDDGESFFEGRESISFGAMNAVQWNNQFYKHIDHHFQQFGV